MTTFATSLTTQQIAAHVTALNSIIWLYGALDDAKLRIARAERAGGGAISTHDPLAKERVSGAVEAFVSVLLADGWREFGSHEYIHDILGIVDLHGIALVNGLYEIGNHAFVAHHAGYRDPVVPLTDEPEDE